MNTKNLIYTTITAFAILLPWLGSNAQKANRHQRQVTISQTVEDGKVISSDTIIIETDTVRRTVNSKEISMELPYTKSTTINIDNVYRKINIRKSANNQVRLVATAFYYGEPAFTNEQWLEKLNIQVKNTDTGITIISSNNNHGKKPNVWSSSYRTYSSDKPAPPMPPLTTATTGTAGVKKSLPIGRGATVYEYAPSNGVYSRGNGVYSGSSVAVFDDQGAVSYNSSSQKNELTVYIPAGAKVDVASRYADVSVDHDLTDIKANISNASLDMLNAGNARISGTYSNVTAGNIDNADIAITSGKLFIKDVKQLQLRTRYTKVEAGHCGIIQLKSESDDYDIEEVKNFSGQKTYGSLRVDKLTSSFDLSGSSADLKIRTIEPSVSVITIDNKYADVRLPVASLHNYQVSFTGPYSSVFAPFEREVDTAQSSVTQKTDRTNITYTVRDGLFAPVKKGAATPPDRTGSFTASVGNVKGTHTAFKLTCTSCNVDFK